MTGKATSAQTGAATLVSIQNMVSGLGNDTITGDASNNAFFAAVGDGNDNYTGGGGIDTYDLSLTAAGTNVNLGLGTATGADTGTDTLVGIDERGRQRRQRPLRGLRRRRQQQLQWRVGYRHLRSVGNHCRRNRQSSDRHIDQRADRH